MHHPLQEARYVVTDLGPRVRVIRRPLKDGSCIFLVDRSVLEDNPDVRASAFDAFIRHNAAAPAAA